MQGTQDFKQTPQRAQESQQTCDRGGCQMRVVPGTLHCPMHQPPSRNLYNFERGKVIQRLKEMRAHPDSHTLEVELGLIRHILEKVVNSCEDDMDLIRNSAQISMMVDKVQNLLKTNIQVGQITGQLMSLEEVVGIGQQLVGIVSDYVSVADLEQVIERFESLFEQRAEQ